jgi:hypothetical protein
MRPAAVHRISDCIANRIRLAVPQATERQGIADEIDASLVCTGIAARPMRLVRTTPATAPTAEGDVGLAESVRLIPTTRKRAWCCPPARL